LRRVILPALAATISLVAPAPASAQESAEVAEMKAEIARLRAQLRDMEARLDRLDRDAAPAPVSAPSPAISAAQPAARPPRVEVAPEVEVTWKGAPQFTGPGGVSFKPRGRLQFDASGVTRPEGIGEPTLGWSADVRRAFLGVDGKFGAGLGYRFEVDFASGSPVFTDLWMTYETGDVLITLGHDRMTTLEDLTSDLDTSLLERAAFVTAFGFERRLGLSAAYSKGDMLLSAGIYADDLQTLGSGVADNSFSLDTRAVYAPKLGDTRLHFGASVHHRELNDLTNSVRYRARPGTRTTDMRFVDTGMFSGTAETGYGLEFAAQRGPVHLAAEGFWQRVDRPLDADPTFFGAYGEIGYVFAGGGVRPLEDGAFGRITSPRGLDKGGLGTWQINLRYDWLDLDDRGVRGGTQRTLGTSLVWVPMNHVKFMADFLHIMVEDTPILAGANDDYDVDVIGLRAQYDF
jgi:phosphate-selective porin OprO/OprP